MKNMVIDYKGTGEKSKFSTDLLSECTSSNEYFSDPPVDVVPPPSLDSICKWIISAIGIMKKGAQDELLNALDQIYNALILHRSSTFPKWFIDKSDVCVLISSSWNDNDSRIKYISMKLLELIVSRSTDAIDVFLSYTNVGFFASLIQPNDENCITFFSIVSSMSKTELGAKQIIEFKVTDKFLDIGRMVIQSNNFSDFNLLILHHICSVFVGLSHNFNLIPEFTSRSILDFFTVVIDIKSDFFKLLYNFIITILEEGTESNLIFITSNQQFLRKLNNLLTKNSPNLEHILNIIFTLFANCIKTSNDLPNEISDEKLYSLFIGCDINSHLYPLLSKILKCYILTKSCSDWVFSDATLRKFQDSLDRGNFETKSAIVDCIFTICSFSTIHTLRTYLSTDLLHQCVDFMECLKGPHLIAHLKAVSRLIDQIYKYGLNDSTSLSSLLTRVASVLQGILSSADGPAHAYADRLLSFYFPEQYYA